MFDCFRQVSDGAFSNELLRNIPKLWIQHVVDAYWPDPNTREPWVQERGVSVLGDYWTCMTTGKALRL